jgi:hypothetical protein
MDGALFLVEPLRLVKGENHGGSFCPPRRQPPERPQGCPAGSGSMSSDFERITDLSNLWRCWLKTRKGKFGKNRVQRFDVDAMKYLVSIQQRLRDDTFRFGPYRYFEVVDKKRRDVVDSPMKDRVVHRMIYDHLAPRWNQRFIHDSYGNIKGKGTLKALQCAAEFARKPCNLYALQLDISKFFYSVPHDVLLDAVLRHEGDQRIRDLLIRLVDSFYTDDRYDALFEEDSAYRSRRDKGMPLGNLTSQLFCNILLNDFDHFVKEQIGLRFYLRYVDDILVFGDNTRTLHEIADHLTEYLYGLGLQVHPQKRSVRPVTSGIPYLGMIIWPNHLSAGKRLRRNYHRALRLSGGSLAKDQAIQAYLGWFSHFGAGR